VKLVIKADKDRKIKFCCLQSEAAEPYMRICGVDREDVLRRFLFIEGPDAYHQGSTAALKVLSYLPLPYSALSTLMIVPTPIRDAAYDYIAKRRYDWFGKDTNCLVLKEKELLERFLDRDEMIRKKWPTTTAPSTTNVATIQIDEIKNYVEARAACEALGLINGDEEWIMAFQEADGFATASELRRLSVHILIFCNVSSPINLWKRLWQNLFDDVPRKLSKSLRISQIQRHGKKMQDIVSLNIELMLNS
nr:hypothetical protein [Tanacetum cinerariifolium]